jgi:diguanylate cyclase (GGDEF)-like protein
MSIVWGKFISALEARGVSFGDIAETSDRRSLITAADIIDPLDIAMVETEWSARSATTLSNHKKQDGNTFVTHSTEWIVSTHFTNYLSAFIFSKRKISMTSFIKPIVIAADSDAEGRASIRQVLQEDYTLLEASDGLDVLLLLKNNKNVNAIIMSPTMPNFDGIAATRMLKADCSTYYIPVIMVTEHIHSEGIIEAAESGADDFMHKPLNAQELKARLVMNIRQAERNQNANPLTKLPGNELINRVVCQRLDKPCAVLYLDLDHFKAYNDKYGFSKGDDVLKHTANLLVSIVQDVGNADDFVGHIGGDDFVIVSTPSSAARISQHICVKFDETIVSFYNEEDRTRNKIVSVNRRGQVEEFPLLSISIAAVTNENRELTSMPQISQLAAQLKKYAKTKPSGELGSSYVADSRKN